AVCGRVIQSSGPLRYAIVDGMNVRDSRVHNYPARWNAAPSQELLVIRRNHQTGEVSLDPLRWGLVPYWCQVHRAPPGQRNPKDVVANAGPAAAICVQSPQCSAQTLATHRATAWPYSSGESSCTKSNPLPVTLSWFG